MLILLQLSEFADILLQEDYNTPLPEGELHKYENFVTVDKQKTTVLHLAAERDLLQIASIFVKLYGNHVYKKNLKERRLPVEIALDKKKDNTASFLMKNMLNER